MNILPSFILKRIYKKGSLRRTKDGVAFDLKNILGPGIVTGINYIKINDETYTSSMIRIMSSGDAVPAAQISADNPMIFRLNEEITCLIEGCLKLSDGLNNIIVELISKDVGKVSVALSDMV